MIIIINKALKQRHAFLQLMITGQQFSKFQKSNEHLFKHEFMNSNKTTT